MDEAPVLTYLTSPQGRLAQKEAHHSCGPTVWRNNDGGGVRQMLWGLECQAKPSGPSRVCLGAIAGLRAGEWPTQSPHLEMESCCLQPAGLLSCRGRNSEGKGWDMEAYPGVGTVLASGKGAGGLGEATRRVREGFSPGESGRGRIPSDSSKGRATGSTWGGG